MSVFSFQSCWHFYVCEPSFQERLYLTLGKPRVCLWGVEQLSIFLAYSTFLQLGYFFFCIYKRKRQKHMFALYACRLGFQSRLHGISLFLKKIKIICSFVAFKFLFEKRKRIVFAFRISFIFAQSFRFNFESKHHISFTPFSFD